MASKILAILKVLALVLIFLVPGLSSAIVVRQSFLLPSWERTGSVRKVISLKGSLQSRSLRISRSHQIHLGLHILGLLGFKDTLENGPLLRSE